MSSSPPLQRLLLTGAAGGLGKVLRERLRPMARVLRLSDLAPVAPAEGEFEEAARRHGVKRIVFASSNHVIGFYKQDEHIDAHAARRPDGYYGLSKSFGEDVAQFYFDRYGIETVSIRIGSSFPEPANRRMMSTWLSYDDLTDLLEKSLFTPGVKHTVVYGMSANKDVWWDNSAAAHLGFQPRDSSEVFRAKVEAQPPVPPTDPNAIYQGGAFTAQGPFGD
jgi:uronate dehydrogenase